VRRRRWRDDDRRGRVVELGEHDERPAWKVDYAARAGRSERSASFRQADAHPLTAPAGKVTIVMANPSPLQHDVAIQGNGVDVAGAVVSKGGTSTVSADLKPGTYTFLCTVDGHAAAGMKGTLTVP